ncbi:hypothetical protein BsWGS_21806 [Bradybaena similaris]
MAKLASIVVLVVGLLCVNSQPAAPVQGDDPPASGGTDTGVLRPGLSQGKETETPGKKGPGSPEQVSLFDRLDNETEYKRAEGDRYTWEHDLGTGETVSERAFAPNGSSVIVFKSRDRALEAKNITRSTSVYAFSDLSSIVAVIPWRRSGPCLVRNSSLTYQSAKDMLTARNGSTVKTLSRISVDGNVPPLSTEEKTTFLATNPQLRRACGQRLIVVTTEIGDNSAPFSNSTEEILTFSLEAEVSIIVPERPELPDTTKYPDDKRRPGGNGNRWGPKNV